MVSVGEIDQTRNISTPSKIIFIVIKPQPTTWKALFVSSQTMVVICIIPERSVDRQVVIVLHAIPQLSNIVWGQAHFVTVEGVLSSFFVATVTTVANGHICYAHFKGHFQLREKVENIRIWCRPWLRRVDMKQSPSRISFILKTVKCFLSWLIWGLNKSRIEKVFFLLLSVMVWSGFLC